jgi:hypothetical protein
MLYGSRQVSGTPIIGGNYRENDDGKNGEPRSDPKDNPHCEQILWSERRNSLNGAILGLHLSKGLQDERPTLSAVAHQKGIALVPPTAWPSDRPGTKRDPHGGF